MSTSVLLRPRNGLGDKLLDVLGLVVWARGYRGAVDPVVDWCSTDDYQPWGNARYDAELFVFPFLLGRGPADVLVTSTDPSSSFCPERVKGYLRDKAPDDVAVTYVETAAGIGVSPRVARKAPQGIEMCVGVHLRRKDKVRADGDSRHETQPSELDDIMSRVWQYIDELIALGTRHFFVCGDEDEAVACFQGTLRSKDPSVRVVTPDYADCNLPGEKDVLDWYCLTRCWKVVQGIKYSTFSMSAAIVSQAPLVNFADHDSNALLHLWRPCLLLEAHGNMQNPFPATSFVREASFVSWAQHKWWPWRKK
jgi:hypothetical protein